MIEVKFSPEIQEAIDKALDRYIKELRKPEARIIPNTQPDEKNPAKRGDAGFNTFGEFLWTIKNKPGDVRLKTGSVEGDDTAGGYLIPEEFRNQILMDALELTVMRRAGATVIPMRTDTIRIPKVTDTAHTASVFGGVVAYWTDEQGTVTPKDPTFGSVRLIARKLTGYTYASNELLADSAVGLEALLLRMFSQALAWYEDSAFINGDGVGKPLGYLKSGALLAVNRSATSTIAIADLASIMGRFLPQSLPRAVWIANPNTLSQLIKLGSTYLTWFGPTGSIAGAPPSTLLGKPIYFTEHASAVGTAGDITLVDPSYYLIGDRQTITVAASEHTRFTTDETAWRFVERVDGQPWIDSAFTPAHGSSLSPFVTLHSTTNGGD